MLFVVQNLHGHLESERLDVVLGHRRHVHAHLEEVVVLLQLQVSQQPHKPLKRLLITVDPHKVHLKTQDARILNVSKKQRKLWTMTRFHLCRCTFVRYLLQGHGAECLVMQDVAAVWAFRLGLTPALRDALQHRRKRRDADAARDENRLLRLEHLARTGAERSVQVALKAKGLLRQAGGAEALLSTACSSGGKAEHSSVSKPCRSHSKSLRGRSSVACATR